MIKEVPYHGPDERVDNGPPINREGITQPLPPLQPGSSTSTTPSTAIEALAKSLTAMQHTLS